jgi:hypothetical protein
MIGGLPSKNLHRRGSLLSGESLRFALGNFARWGIESRLGNDLAAGAQLALAHYARRLRSGRKPVAPPAFLRYETDSEVTTSLDLALEPGTLSILKREAARHQVPLERILAHAIFVYLADLDGVRASSQLGSPTLV